MRKYKFFTNFDEEEHWLNDMARQGWRFARKTPFGYEFESAKPENAVIKIDYRSFKKQRDFEDYCALFEDSGWEHIAGTKSTGHQYFKKIGCQGREDIFSDGDSKAGRYKRLSDMWAALACSFVPLLAVLISTGAIDPGVLLDLKALYYTPGLWELSGAGFWRAFLFETPFALFRGVFWLIIPIMIVIYLYFASKANRQYKKSSE
ncbi:DUF2812 domain-containing protein [Paenibacillus doosanensis]|uniref:DUF2812 domain-containing protein n=1 Tax=Paenibacillus konkukensis TaxID=2020716 RepID=A0ABY4RGA6_9BACL|nr:MULTISPECIES: DUF2812 domain-containing protein [Paenibacillus]MCS7460599.1 DUF2812 domain-containing protein [Paenibacillus doosanensis]UQZ81180.1 hypothetical protein SK3146_00336 [Paenibacillus konkukensis]